MSNAGKILSNQFVEKRLIDETIEDFAALGISLESDRDESDKAYNYVEIIVPTAIIVGFAANFFGEIVKELAKDSYSVTKKLLRRAFGANREVHYELRRVNGEVIPPTFSRDLSFAFKFDEDFTIVLLLKANASEDQALVHFTKAMTLMAELSKDPKQLRELRKFLAGQVGFFGTAYLIYEGDDLKFLDWVTTSQQGSVNSFVLP